MRSDFEALKLNGFPYGSLHKSPFQSGLPWSLMYCIVAIMSQHCRHFVGGFLKLPITPSFCFSTFFLFTLCFQLQVLGNVLFFSHSFVWLFFLQRRRNMQIWDLQKHRTFPIKVIYYVKIQRVYLARSIGSFCRNSWTPPSVGNILSVTRRNIPWRFNCQICKGNRLVDRLNCDRSCFCVCVCVLFHICHSHMHNNCRTSVFIFSSCYFH